MNIVIFGASGGTGGELVRRGLQLGHRVTAFVRNPARFKLAHERLTVLQGDVNDYKAVAAAVQAGDTVLSALGASSPLKRDRALVQGIRHIVEAMEMKGAERIIYLSFAGVGSGKVHLVPFFRLFMLPFLTNIVKDHEEKEAIIQRSKLRWTIVRPAILTHGAYTGEFRSGENYKPPLQKLWISRADVAHFMLLQLNDDTYLGKTPFLARG